MAIIQIIDIVAYIRVLAVEVVRRNQSGVYFDEEPSGLPDRLNVGSERK